nr:PAS domain-containing protein [uncultured Dongia sp.]
MTSSARGFERFADVTQARMSSTAALFTYWRDHRPLKRTDVDPSAITAILPLVLLGDIEPMPFRVLFRLIGTSVADFSRQDFTGQYLDELIYSARDSVDWQQCYRYVHVEKAPIIGINDLHFIDGRVARYEFCILPLLRGGDPAGSFIAIEAYDHVDRCYIPDLNPVKKRS